MAPKAGSLSPPPNDSGNRALIGPLSVDRIENPNNFFTSVDLIIILNSFPIAGWSSPVARQAHNLKVLSSNLSPAPNFKALNPAQSVTCGIFVFAEP